MAAIQTATAATLEAALSRLAHAPLLDHFLDGTLLTDDLLYCDDGAIFAQRLGGAQAAIVPPSSRCPHAAYDLTAALVEHLQSLGHRVLQTVVPNPPPQSMDALARVGFVHVTDLIFLARSVTVDDAFIPPRLAFEPACMDDLEFAALIEATFVGTQDLPELNGTRSVEETLIACQAAARVEPPLWWFASLEGSRIGVLQMAPGEEPGDIELLYAGLVPSARRRGLGRELTQAALAIAVALEATRVHLSRDARNESAGHVYDQLGFQPVRRRAVWLRICRDSAQHSQRLQESETESS